MKIDASPSLLSLASTSLELLQRTHPACPYIHTTLSRLGLIFEIGNPYLEEAAHHKYS